MVAVKTPEDFSTEVGKKIYIAEIFKEIAELDLKIASLRVDELKNTIDNSHLIFLASSNRRIISMLLRPFLPTQITFYNEFIQ